MSTAILGFTRTSALGAMVTAVTDGQLIPAGVNFRNSLEMNQIAPENEMGKTLVIDLKRPTHTAECLPYIQLHQFYI